MGSRTAGVHILGAELQICGETTVFSIAPSITMGINMLRSTGKRRALTVLEKPEALSCLDTLIPYLEALPYSSLQQPTSRQSLDISETIGYLQALSTTIKARQHLDRKQQSLHSWLTPKTSESSRWANSAVRANWAIQKNIPIIRQFQCTLFCCQGIVCSQIIILINILWIKKQKKPIRYSKNSLYFFFFFDIITHSHLFGEIVCMETGVRRSLHSLTKLSGPLFVWPMGHPVQQGIRYSKVRQQEAEFASEFTRLCKSWHAISFAYHREDP